MKTLFIFTAFICSQAMAADVGLIYGCEFRIVRPGKPLYVMRGNIVPEDASASDSQTTYLTLAPNQLSGIPLEARILFTTYDFNPITLHKPGQSASTVASTRIESGQSARLGYVDESGVSYSVSCAPR